MPSSVPSRVLQWSPGWDVKNPSTMVLSHPKLMNHINPTLAHLHWCPVESRNFYKSFFSPKNAFMPLAPSSTHMISITTIACPEICGPPPPNPPTPTCHLSFPHQLAEFWGQSLHCGSPTLWNSLLEKICNTAFFGISTKKKTIENLPIYQRRWFLVNFCQPRQCLLSLSLFSVHALI